MLQYVSHFNPFFHKQMGRRNHTVILDLPPPFSRHPLPFLPLAGIFSLSGDSRPHRGTIGFRWSSAMAMEFPCLDLV
jgi:hypothetical protein